jgi:hypothetical protein
MGEGNGAASIRIIKIVKDIDTFTKQETEAFTAEIEIVCDSIEELMQTLESTPVGKDISAMIQRANFIPKTPDEDVRARMEQEEKDMKEHEDAIRKEEYERGCHETREKYIAYIKRKNGRDSIEAVKEEAEKTEDQKDAEELADALMVPSGGFPGRVGGGVM